MVRREGERSEMMVRGPTSDERRGRTRASLTMKKREPEHSVHNQRPRYNVMLSRVADSASRANCECYASVISRDCAKWKSRGRIVLTPCCHVKDPLQRVRK